MDTSLQEEFRWLVSPAAESLLAQAMKGFEDRANALSIAKHLRKQISSGRAALVMEQAQLRIRARRKFIRADSMFFTRRGLEQATSQWIAEYKAREMASLIKVADICCGIGGDLVSLAGRAPDVSTVGIDSDATTSLFAAMNLRAHGFNEQTTARAWVQEMAFESLNLGDFDGLHIDPDRRQQRRTVVGSQFSPPLSQIYQRTSRQRLVAIKVAPATPLDESTPQECLREWIGDRRECKQQVLWTGTMIQQSIRRATRVLEDGQVCQFECAEVDMGPRPESVGEVQTFVFEPHATVLASKLTDAFSNQLGCRRMTADIPYLTSHHRIDHPLLAAFEVLDVLRLDGRAIKASLAKHGIGVLELKHRGIDKVTAKAFSRLRGDGDASGVLILTRVGTDQKRKAILARRI